MKFIIVNGDKQYIRDCGTPTAFSATGTGSGAVCRTCPCPCPEPPPPEPPQKIRCVIRAGTAGPLSASSRRISRAKVCS